MKQNMSILNRDVTIVIVFSQEPSHIEDFHFKVSCHYLGLMILIKLKFDAKPNFDNNGACYQINLFGKTSNTVNRSRIYPVLHPSPA